MNSFFGCNHAIKLSLVLIVIVLNSCGILNKNKSNKMILNGIINQSILTGNKNYNWFDNEYKNYAPNIETIDSLKPLKNVLKVLIIAGSWCSDTQRELPRFLKICNAIGIPNNSIEIIMVDENKKTLAINISVLQITNIPTFIIYKDGKEQGRIIEKPILLLENDLMNIISKK